MNNINEEMKFLHTLSFKNEIELKNSKKVGCFYCEKVYNVEDVKSWIQEDDNNKTAVCPHCHIDSVLPFGEDIDKNTLRKMNETFF